MNIKYVKSIPFGEEYLGFDDVHGLRLELVKRNAGKKNYWIVDNINEDVAIKGFGGAFLFSSRPDETANVLVDVMGLKKVEEDGEFIRFQSPGDIGNIVDVKKITSTRGSTGTGIVHHIAWRAEDGEDQVEWLSLVKENGFISSEVRDRNYFTSFAATS